MHILIVDHVSDLGGAELSLESLVTCMPHEYCRYTVALPGPGRLVDRLKSRSVHVELVPLESWRWWVNSPWKAIKYALTFPLQIASLWRWIRFLRKTRPDLVHFNVNRLVEPVLAARLSGIPSIVHFRDIPSRIRFRFVLGQRVLYAIMNLANHWIANSSATRDDILPYARCPVTTIPNGIDLLRFDEMSGRSVAGIARNEDEQKNFAVAMVAGLTPWKDHSAYLQMVKLVCERRCDVRFFVAGSGDPNYMIELKKLAARLRIADRVEFLGYVENIPHLLTRIDILVHTTPYEPFGRVFIEAMAARIPVVAMKGGGAVEVVEDNKTGVLIPLGNIENMAATVSDLLDNATLRRQMGEAGRWRVEQYYTIERHCKAVASLYEEMLGQQ